MKSLFETLSAQTKRQSDLLQAGLSPEEATRIAFNPENEAVIQVEKEIFNHLLRMAFVYGGQQEFRTNAGTATMSELEAMNNCIKVINELVQS